MLYTFLMKTLLSYLREYYALGSIGEITWAHAVNSQQRLQRFLNDPEVMILEVDVIVASSGEVILAHPPAHESDLSLVAFLQAMSASNPAIKLDFKDPSAIAPALKHLRAFGLDRPIILNADIVQGANARHPWIPAEEFLSLCCTLYPQGILSPGWTTYQTPYSQQNIDEMLALCRDIEAATFPVRASMLPASWIYISQLLQREGYSLTIWNSEPPDDHLLAWIREHTDPTRTCYDLVDKDKNPIRLW